jgi:CYTH domain-containing protein
MGSATIINTGKPEGGKRYCRAFLLKAFPPNIQNNSEHLQILDKYSESFSMRLRSIRNPKAGERVWLLEKREVRAGGGAEEQDLEVIRISAEEYAFYEPFSDSEVRKNRYSYRHEGGDLEIDSYLGPLRGVFIAKMFFSSPDEARAYKKPEFAIADISGDPLFRGPTLASKEFTEIRDRFFR